MEQPTPYSVLDDLRKAQQFLESLIDLEATSDDEHEAIKKALGSVTSAAFDLETLGSLIGNAPWFLNFCNQGKEHHSNITTFATLHKIPLYMVPLLRVFDLFSEQDAFKRDCSELQFIKYNLVDPVLTIGTKWRSSKLAKEIANLYPSVDHTLCSAFADIAVSGFNLNGALGILEARTRQ